MYRAVWAAFIVIALTLGSALPGLAAQVNDLDAVRDEAGAAYANGDYATVLRLLRPLADAGDAWAQTSLGVLYALGRGVAKDQGEAVKWFRKAAEQGDAYGQYKLGGKYFFGGGVKQDYGQAEKWLRLAADQGHAKAIDLLAYMLENNPIAERDRLKKLENQHRAAKQGDVDAQFALGEFLGKGEYTSHYDAVKAVKWYRLAAAQGHAEAQLKLANRLSLSDGVARDYAEAAKWYRRAADQGLADAQASLGELYRRGLGVTRDYAQALSWFRRAVEQGNAVGQIGLGGLYQSGKGVPEDPVKAVMWYRKGALQGDVIGQFALGGMYAAGRGVPEDPLESAKWYRRAAEQGHTGSQVILGERYQSGKDLPQDDVEAYMWFDLAASQSPPTKIALRETPEMIRNSARILQSVAKKNRDKLAARMTPGQLVEALRRLGYLGGQITGKKKTNGAGARGPSF